MNRVENQAYLTGFIMETAADLKEISQDNPALYNALVNAFGIMSEEFGTGETEIEKVEEVKVVPKIETPEKKKRGRKKKITITEVNQMSEEEVDDEVAKIPAETLQWIENLTVKGTPVTSESSTHLRAVPKLIDNEIPRQVFYDVVAANTTDVIEANQKRTFNVWALTIFIGYNFFVDDNGNKIELNTPMIAPVTQTTPQSSTPQSPSGYQSFNIPDGKGGIEVIYLTSDKPTLNYKISEEDLISKGNLLFRKNSRHIFNIIDVRKVLFEADSVDDDGDIVTTNFDKQVFLDNVKDGNWLLVKPTGKYQMGIRTFNVFSVDLIKSTAKKPQKQADPEEIAALELELENAELFAELGDEDAKKEVSKLKKKIAKLKA